MDLEGCGCGLIEVVSQYLLGGTEEDYIKRVRIAGFFAKM
jgi:hypothetical protein